MTRKQTSAQDQLEIDDIDYNALDNTTGGRAIQAGFVFAALSVPDYVAPGAPRVATIAVVAVANLVTIAAFNAFDEDPRNDLSAILDWESEAGTEEVASPAKTWAVLLGLIVVGALVLAGGEKLVGALAKQLRKRGVTKPHTVIGGVAAALAFALMELQARK
ncbi:hypothetical protein [Corynebacterium lubricantis]|uniref:hypothetical protein n=1 Tax=Corynebacterium lubricantis TaxID=541095 RepID=UPI0003721E39|nr:hypothetical protein [Corynebacterium lubricantis]